MNETLKIKNTKMHEFKKKSFPNYVYLTWCDPLIGSILVIYWFQLVCVPKSLKAQKSRMSKSFIV